MKNNLRNMVSEYNRKVLDLIDLKRLEVTDEEESIVRQNKIYRDNVLDLTKIKAYIRSLDDETSENSLINNIKNNNYYNIYSEDSNSYKIIFKYSKVIKKGVNISIDSDGVVTYNELKKLQFVIGRPCFEKITIEELYCILYKLSLENLVDVDLTYLKTAIDINRLNRSLNDNLSEMIYTKNKKLVKNV